MFIFGEEIKILMKEKQTNYTTLCDNSEVTCIEFKVNYYHSAVYIIRIWTQLDVKLFKYILSREIKIWLKKARESIVFIRVWINRITIK